MRINDNLVEVVGMKSSLHVVCPCLGLLAFVHLIRVNAKAEWLLLSFLAKVLKFVLFSKMMTKNQEKQLLISCRFILDQSFSDLLSSSMENLGKHRKGN